MKNLISIKKNYKFNFDHLIFKVKTTASNQVVTLPTPQNDHKGVALTYNYNVKWGDGFNSTQITTYNDANRSHTFVLAGEYYIEISGICEGIDATKDSANEFKSRLIKIVSWGITGMLKYINFKLCALLTELPNQSGRLTNIRSLSYTFYGTSIVTIPAGLFMNSTSIDDHLTTMYTRTFASNNSLKYIKENIFKNSNVVNLSNAFQNCNGLIGGADISVNAIQGASGLKQLNWLFNGCYNLQSVNQYFLSGLDNLTTVNSMFHYCTSLTGVGTDFLKVNDFSNGVDSVIGGLFNGCTSLITPPDFDNNTFSLKRFETVFKNCTSLTSYPALVNTYSIVSFHFSYENCTSLTSFPPGAFLNGRNSLCDYESMFKGCTGITTMASNFLNQVPDNSNITMTDMFKNCSGITSNVQDVWNNHTNVTNHDGCYEGCVNSSNYNLIPIAWK